MSGEPRSSPSRAWPLAAAALLLLAGLLMAALLRDYGPTWDEEIEVMYGDAVISWWGSGFRDETALHLRDMRLFGALFDVVGQLAVRLSPGGLFETRHAVNVLFALLGAAATFLLGRRLAGPRAGFLASALLLLTPVWWGHSFNNPKDVPFAAMTALALVALLRAGDERSTAPTRGLLLAGVATGLALAVRPGALFLLLGVALFALVARRLAPAEAAPSPRPLGALRATAWRFLALAAIAWGLMLLFWPWGQTAPLLRPFQLAAGVLQWPHRIPIRFDGQIFAPAELPRSYLPTWFALTLPETWFLAAAAGAAWLVRFLRAPGGLRVAATSPAAVLALAAAGPVALAVLLKPTVYDGIRHFLFTLPPAAALAASGLDRALTALTPRLRGALAAAAAGTAALVAADMVALHPYQYVYFNRLVAGGLPGSASRYETDNWGVSVMEGTRWLIEHYRPETARRIRVAASTISFQAAYWLEKDPALLDRFEVVEFDDDSDVVLATTQRDRHLTPGRILHVVERRGVALLHVIERRPPGEPRPGRPPRFVLPPGEPGVRSLRLADPGRGALILAAPGTWGLIQGPGWDDLPRFRLASGAPNGPFVTLTIIPPNRGATDLDGLRASLEAKLIQTRRRAGRVSEIRPLRGPEAQGWYAEVEPRATQLEPRRQTLGALRIGDENVRFLISSAPDDTRTPSELLELLAAARIDPSAGPPPAAPEDR